MQMYSKYLDIKPEVAAALIEAVGGGFGVNHHFHGMPFPKVGNGSAHSIIK